MAAKPKTYSAPPPMTIDPDKSYTATIILEKGGEIVIELFAKEAPNTVNNFVFLAQDGYYNQVTFHRVIAGFMAQGGDPTGTGRGGPGYEFDNELSPLRRHDTPRGAVHGQQGVKRRSGHQWQPVLHNLRANTGTRRLQSRRHRKGLWSAQDLLSYGLWEGNRWDGRRLGAHDTRPRHSHVPW